MNFRSLPRLLQFYIEIVILCGLATLAVTANLPNGRSAAPGVTLTLILCSIIFSTWKVSLLHGGVMTLTSAPVCLAMLLDGPLTAVLCAFSGALVGTLARPVPGRWRPNFVWDKQFYRPIFNVAICTVAAGLAAAVYYWAFGALFKFAHAAQWPAADLAARAIAAMAFQSVHFLINTLGVATALTLQRSGNLLKIWRDNFFWTISSYVTTASLAVVIYAFAYRLPWIGIGLLVLLSPFYLMYKFYCIEAEKRDLSVAKLEHDKRHVEELNELNSAIIASLATAIDAKDRYTRSHINRVQMYAVGLGEAVGLTGPDLEAVRTGALIHDIGKLGIPERILGKPGKLTPDEFRRMQAHVQIGVEILAPVRFPYPVIPIVETHHERWDGLGYPNGLRAEEIPIGGRIMAIADVFDALTSNRPYRRALELEEALDVLREGAAKHFDPHLVDVFCQILPEVRIRVEEMELKQDEEAAKDGQSATDTSTALHLISQAAAEMSAACELAQSFAETTTSREVLDVVIDRTLKLLPADTAVVYLFQADSQELRADGIGGRDSEKLAGLTMTRGEGVSGWVAETLQPQINAQASLDIGRRYNPNEVMELSAAACVPLVQDGQTLGVLTLYTVGYTTLHEHHIGVLNVIAEHTAAALASARRYELTRELSLTDPLTSLPNSRSLIHRMETLCSGLSGEEVPEKARFAVLMLDLDGFKMVNDVLGHLRGDEVLREFGQILRELCRPQDHPCRYAGDEFVVVLNAGADEAYVDEFTRRVRKALHDRSRHWMSNSVQVSIGTAYAPKDGTEVRSLLAVADERMYNDKFMRRTTLGLSREAEPEGAPVISGWGPPPSGTAGE